jgi:hypothetical protein
MFDISKKLSIIKDGSLILLDHLFFNKNNDRFILGGYLKLIKDRYILKKNYLLLTSNYRGFLQTNNSIFFGRNKT